MPHAGPAPAVSVLMPVYNGERFLAEAVESILGQTFADFEFVIVDDGSTDASPAILADYASRDPRIRVVAQANAGIVAALNRGLNECRSPLVARMDADDVSLPTRLEQQVAFLTDHPKVAAVGTAFRLISETGAAGPEVRPPAAHKAIKRGLRYGNCLGHPTVMMRREAILAVGGYREFLRHAEDYDLWTRVAERYELANLPACLLRYRVHAAQVSWNSAEQQALSTLAVQGLSRSRRLINAEPILPDRPTREFLAELGFSSSDINFLLLTCIANRMDVFDSVGMHDKAVSVRQLLLDNGNGEEFCTMQRMIAVILTWKDLRTAMRTRRLQASVSAFVRWAAACSRDFSTMRAVAKRLVTSLEHF